MDSPKNNLSPYAQMIQHGLAQSNRKLLELDAALGRKMVFGHLDGTFEEVDARRFLNEVKASEWWKQHFDKEPETDK